MNQAEARDIYNRLDSLEAKVSIIAQHLELTELLPHIEDVTPGPVPQPEPVYDEPATDTEYWWRESTNAPGWPMSSLGLDILAAGTTVPRAAPYPDPDSIPAPTGAPDIEQESLPSKIELQSTEAAEPRHSSFDVVRSTGFWLSKVGIVLFLFGVAFLFKYAVDRQWLSEQVRVGIGIMLGTGLLCAGLLVSRTRRNLSQVLLGGGIATYYITGFAAYQLFPSLHIGYESAFFFMSVVTLLAFVLSVRRGDVALSFIGLLGGFLTPFALGIQHAQVTALLGYTCLLLAGTGAIYLARGWRSLLWGAMPGAWAITIVSYFNRVPYGSPNYEALDLEHSWAMQGTLAMMLLAFWAVPVLREALVTRFPARWSRPQLPRWIVDFVLLPSKSYDDSPPLPLFDYQARTLAVLMPLAILGSSAMVWGSLVEQKAWGWIAIGGAAVFALVFLGLQKLVTAAAKQGEAHPAAILSCRSLAYTHAMLAVGWLTMGLGLSLEGNWLLIALAVEGLALHLLAWRFKDLGTSICSHSVFVLCVYLLGTRFLTPPLPTEHLLVSPEALTSLLVIVSMMAASFLQASKEEVLAYRSVAHLAVMVWLWRELQGFPNGGGYVMLAWAAYGVLLHFASRKLADKLNSMGTAIAAHVAFEGAMGILAFRLAHGLQGDLPIFNSHAMLDLVMIAAALATSFLVGQRRVAAFYRVSVHAAVLAWLLRESPATMTGWELEGYVMLRWAIYLTMVAFIAHKLRDRASLFFAEAGFVVVTLMLWARIWIGHEGDLALLNARSAVDLAVLGLACAASMVMQTLIVRREFQGMLHAAMLGILWREFGYLPSGFNYVLLAWAAYALLFTFALDIIATVRREKADLSNIAMSHALFAFTGVCLLGRIAWGLSTKNPDQMAVLNATGIANLAVIVAGVAMALAFRRQRTGWPEWAQRLSLGYGLWLHVAVLGWLWQELGLAQQGNGYVTIAWGAYAIVLVLGALSRWGKERLSSIGGKAMLYCGISTLFLVAGKLFLVDLRYLDPIWRILLFLGFGGLFLLLSYFFQGFSRSDSQSPLHGAVRGARSAWQRRG